MNLEEENRKYRQIIGTQSDFYCIVTHPSLKKRSIKAMGIDAYHNKVEVTPFQPKWHQLVYITHGELQVHFGDSTKTAKAGEIMIMPAQLHRSLSAEMDAGWLWVHLQDVPVYSFLKAKGIQIRKCDEGTDLMRLYSLLRGEPQGSVIEGSYIEIISEKLIRLILKNKMRPHEVEFNALWQKVRELPDLPWSIEILCEEMKISKGHLHKLCTKYFNSSPRDIINNIRLEYGAFLLRATTKKIETIAYECGFSSARAFSKSFLKRYNTRPGKFRHH